MHIKEIYRRYKEESKKTSEQKALIKRRNDKQSALQRISSKVNSADTYQHRELKALKNEINTLKSRIAQLKKEQERKGHKEAKRRTLDCLEKQTGIRIGSRELEALLSLSRKINLSETNN